LPNYTNSDMIFALLGSKTIRVVKMDEIDGAANSKPDVQKILAELKAQREQIDEAILSLERLARGHGRGRGRPPDWMADVAPHRRGRPPGSKNKIPPYDPDLPPAAAMDVPRPLNGLVWAVSGRKRPA